jgi:hypothetical protein
MLFSENSQNRQSQKSPITQKKPNDDLTTRQITCTGIVICHFFKAISKNRLVRVSREKTLKLSAIESRSNAKSNHHSMP